MIAKMVIAIFFFLFSTFSSLVIADGRQIPASDRQSSSAGEASALTSTSFDFKDPRSWVELGDNVGLALAKAAERLGVAGDKVLESNSGKIAVVLISAKILNVSAADIATMPYKIAAFFLGVSMLFIFVIAWIWYFNVLCLCVPDGSVPVHKGLMLSILGSGVLFSFSVAFSAPWVALFSIAIPAIAGAARYLAIADQKSTAEMVDSSIAKLAAKQQSRPENSPPA